jgi:O-antigen/teichoic acid export membrane protein
MALTMGPAWKSWLTALSLAGQLLAYGLGIVLARQLGVAGFESYVVAAAVFILMVTLVPQGLEKYALKRVPRLVEHRQLSLLHGFLRFACVRLLVGSLLVGTAVAACAWVVDGLPVETRRAVVASCLALPAGALAHLGLEVLTALGRPFAASAIFRLLVPATVLAWVGVAVAVVPALRASGAIAAWGLAWCLALAMMAMQVRRAAPAGMFAAVPAVQPSEWVREARPFWLYRISLALLAQAGIVALELLHPSPTALGGFAAALGTAAVAQVLATATNRVYASRLSLLLDQGDIAAIGRLRRDRLRWLAAPLLACLLAALVFAPQLVALFRPEFVAEGAPALRVLACSTAIGTVFAMAPTYLKQLGESRILFRTVAMAATLQLALLWLLVPAQGALGAAIAHAAAAAFLYGALAWVGHRRLAALQR